MGWQGGGGKMIHGLEKCCEGAQFSLLSNSLAVAPFKQKFCQASALYSEVLGVLLLRQENSQS